jgi:hypothetical protein
MVPVIDAIAASSNAFRDQEARAWKLWSGSEQSAVALSETAEKLLSNIGGILVKQSQRPVLRTANGKSCRRAEKEFAAPAPEPP